MTTKKRKGPLKLLPIKIIASAKIGINTKSLDTRISDLADKFNVPLDVGTDFPIKSNFSRGYEFVTNKLSKAKTKALIIALLAIPEIDKRSVTRVSR